MQIKSRTNSYSYSKPSPQKRGCEMVHCLEPPTVDIEKLRLAYHQSNLDGGQGGHKKRNKEKKKKAKLIEIYSSG